MSKTLDIKLLGKDYRVACAPEERESLGAAVEFLQERIATVREKAHTNGERLAVMVALELAHQLVLAQRGESNHSLEQIPTHLPIDSENLRRSINSIEARIAAALEPNETLF